MKIMKKRQEEMQRRTKLLDPRKRQYGVDHTVLDAQVAEKRVLNEGDGAEEAFHARTQAMVDEVLQTIEGAKQDALREREKATKDFSLTNLRKEDRREYYLSDPNMLKNEEPIPDYSKCGPSSMLVFQGHHVPDKSELAITRAETLRKQVQEKKERDDLEVVRDREFDKQSVMAGHIRKHIEQAEEEEHKMETIALAQDNIQIAEQHKARKEAKNAKELDAKAKHVETQKASDFLTEAHDYRIGATGKLVRTEYKRLTMEEQQDVLNTNLRLMLEKKASHKYDKDDEAAELKNIETSIGVLSAIEDEHGRIRKAKQLEIVNHNKALAAAKRENDVKERRAYKSFDYVPGP
jgi:hypothetical protein